MPKKTMPYKRTPTFTQETLPAGLRRNHSTIEGSWAKIIVESGRLKYVIQSDPAEELELGPGQPGIVEPKVLHHVEPLGEVRFYVEFYREINERVGSS